MSQSSDENTGDRLARLEAVVREQQSSLNQIAKQLAGIDDRLSSVDAIRPAIDKRIRRSEKVATNNARQASRDIGRLLGRLSKLSSAYDMSVDARLFEVAQPLVESRRTLLGYDRLFTLWQAAENTVRLNLPAVEVGTFRGGSAALLALAFETFGVNGRELHVVDTFEGHLDSTFSSHDPEEQRGKFKANSYEDVRDFLAPFRRVQVHKGDATAVIAGWPEREYSLVHLDVDLYQPTLDCLEYFGPRLAEGGVIVLDDYEAPTCPGVSRAVEEFLGRSPQFDRWRLQAEQAVLVKRAVSRVGA